VTDADKIARLRETLQNIIHRLDAEANATFTGERRANWKKAAVEVVAEADWALTSTDD
jgi:glycine cleavage system regulatory protein